jgi:hypothetical protein
MFGEAGTVVRVVGIAVVRGPQNRPPIVDPNFGWGKTTFAALPTGIAVPFHQKTPNAGGFVSLWGCAAV